LDLVDFRELFVVLDFERVLFLGIDELVVGQAEGSHILFVVLNCLLNEVLFLNDWVEAKDPKLVKHLLATGFPYFLAVLVGLGPCLLQKRFLPFSYL
jgi:hypothetical protein